MKNIILLFGFFYQVTTLASQDFKILFEQKYKSKISNREKKSLGLLIYSFPQKIRIEIEKPDPVTFVSNGEKSWYYRPPFIEGEPGEVIVNQGGESLNLLATFFDSIQSGFDKTKIFDVKKSEQTVDLTIKPDYRKKVKIKNAKLIFSDKTYALSKIQKMVLTYDNDEKGDFTILKFESLSADKKTFEFVVPPNTKISN